MRWMLLMDSVRKTVYMPTVSAMNHIVGHSGDHFVGSGNMEVEDRGITYVDEAGNIDPAVVKVLEYIARRPELILCTGHGSARGSRRIDRKCSAYWGC